MTIYVDCKPAPDTKGPVKGAENTGGGQRGRREYNVTGGEPRPKN